MDPAPVSDVDASLAAREATYAAPTPDGAYLLTGADSEGTVVNLTTGEEIASVTLGEYLSPEPSPDGAFFATADEDTIRIHRLPDADVVHAFDRPPTVTSGNVRNRVAPGGEFVYYRGPPLPPADVTRYRVTTGEALHRYGTVYDDESVHAFAASADGTTVAVGGIKSPVNGGFVAVYDAASGELDEHWECAYEVDGLALSPDGFAVVFTDGLGGLAGPGWSDYGSDGMVRDACFVRDGTKVLAAVDADGDGTVLQLRDAETGNVEATHAVEADVRRLHSTEDASLVAFSGHPARIIVPDW